MQITPLKAIAESAPNVNVMPRTRSRYIPDYGSAAIGDFTWRIRPTMNSQYCDLPEVAIDLLTNQYSDQLD